MSGLDDLGRTLADAIPEKEFVSFSRAGGRKGMGLGAGVSGALDLKAIRQGKKPIKAMLRKEGTKAKPLTKREHEYLNEVGDR